jgi:hypothetical protein
MAIRKISGLAYFLQFLIFGYCEILEINVQNMVSLVETFSYKENIETNCCDDMRKIYPLCCVVVMLI